MIGDAAGIQGTSGNYNTAIGYSAYATNSNPSSGSNNIAIGYEAGGNALSASNNILIGTRGSNSDNGIIRIGGNATFGDPASQSSFFASGVRGTTTGKSDAVSVVIDSNGQFGTVNSSRTLKRDIEEIGDTTQVVMGLHPVRFRYKSHGPDSPFQYGLIAEEVAEVSPDLVVRRNDGTIETVFYDKVNAILLNQVQIQQRLLEERKTELLDRLRAQDELIHQLRLSLAELESRVK